MEEKKLDDLKTIVIQNDPIKYQSIFADDGSVCHYVSTFTVFALLFSIILFLCNFGPRQIETISSNLALPPPSIRGNSFTSSVSNLSSLNQQLRISFEYKTSATDPKDGTVDYTKISRFKGNFSISLMRAKKELETISARTFSVRSDYVRPIFQSSTINFDRIEIKMFLNTSSLLEKDKTTGIASVSSINDEFDNNIIIMPASKLNNNVTLKFDFIPCEATFFQLKVRTIFSMISIAVFANSVLSDYTYSCQIFTIFLHIAAIFAFDPLQIFQYYFPSKLFTCFDVVVKNTGFVYIYFYSMIIFSTFSDDSSSTRIPLDKTILGISTVSSVILLFISLFIDIRTAVDSDNTLFPKYSIFAPNLNSNDFSMKKSFVCVLLFALPVLFVIIKTVCTVPEAYMHRIIHYSIGIGILAFILGNFQLMNMLNSKNNNDNKYSFQGTSIEWVMPYAALLVFSILFEYLNMDDDRDVVATAYEKAGASGNKKSLKENNYRNRNGQLNEEDEDNALGLDEDEEQIRKKEKESKV